MKILWIPHAGWHIPQRAHAFCHALSKKHEVHVTDWVADFASAKDYLTTRYLRNYTYREYVDQNIQVHGIPRVSPALFLKAIRQFNAWMFSKYVEKIIDTHRIEAVVGTFIIPPPKAKRLIFDLFDDNVAYWRDYRKNSNYAREIEEVETQYIQRADQIVTIGSVLAKQAASKLGGQTERIKIIPNGANLARFGTHDKDGLHKTLGLEGKRVIGYIASFSEYSGLPRLIEAFQLLDDPHLALLLVGEGPQISLARRMVEKHNSPEVIFCGAVPPEEIHRFFALIDVGVIPFDKTAFTDAACPIKLLEYSAAGKIVISSKLTEIQHMGFPNLIYAEQGAESWAEAIKTSLKLQFTRPSDLDRFDIANLAREYEVVLKG